MTASAPRFSNSDSRRVVSVATTACASFSYAARSLISLRMTGTSRSVAGTMRNVMIGLRRGRLSDFDLDELDRHAADVADLVCLAVVEPGPAALLVQLERHRSDGDCLAIRDLKDHGFSRVVMRLGGLSWRERQAIRAEPAIRQLR